MAAVISIALFVILTAVITVFGFRRYARPGRLIDRLSSGPEELFISNEPSRTAASLVGSALASLGGLLPMGPGDIKLARRTLASAGIRAESAVLIFFGIKLIAGVAFFALAFLTRDRITDNPILRIVILFAGAAAGYFGPGLILDRMVTRRREQIRFALPDVLDLLVVCTEVGCALDQALVNVSRELLRVHPAICDELTLLNLEMVAGNSRADALRGFAERAGEDEVKKLVAILVQTDRFGTSISDALRTQADFLRIRRRQEAEERAGKVGVKLVFPIFFFCMPSLLIVTAGPGILQLVKNLFPMMKDFH